MVHLARLVHGLVSILFLSCLAYVYYCAVTDTHSSWLMWGAKIPSVSGGQHSTLCVIGRGSRVRVPFPVPSAEPGWPGRKTGANASSSGEINSP
jgi:hypothetical protein